MNNKQKATLLALAKAYDALYENWSDELGEMLSDTGLLPMLSLDEAAAECFHLAEFAPMQINVYSVNRNGFKKLIQPHMTEDDIKVGYPRPEVYTAILAALRTQGYIQRPIKGCPGEYVRYERIL